MRAVAQGVPSPAIGEYGHEMGGMAKAVRGAQSGGPPRRVPPIVAAAGERFAMRRCTHLTGVRDGEAVAFGACMANRQLTTFDWWFPFVGIAVDGKTPIGGDDEIAVKRTWCHERGIIYFGPDDAADEVLLSDVAHQRRSVSCN